MSESKMKTAFQSAAWDNKCNTKDGAYNHYLIPKSGTDGHGTKHKRL